jgi:hypothetical protein
MNYCQHKKVCSFVWFLFSAIRRNQDSAFWVITSLLAGRSESKFDFLTEAREFSPDRLWDTSNLLHNGCRGFCLRGKNAQCLIVTSHLHLLPRVRVSGFIIYSHHIALLAWAMYFTVFYFVLRKGFIVLEHTSLKININLTCLLLVYCTLEILYDDHLVRILQLNFSTLFCGKGSFCTGRKIYT